MTSGILVTGGAGYIGSHVARQLGERGERVVVLDDLSTGRERSVLHGELVVGSTGDRELVAELLRRHRIDAVLHFAAKLVVPESIEQPLHYYANNVCGTHSLLECCRDAGVRHFVFSSTAAVYGDPATGVATEDTPVAPVSPYGRSKLMAEWMLRDMSVAHPGMSHAILRYFNVAGADPGGRQGQDSPNATHLIKVACQNAVGTRSHVQIHGCDYATPDGTCIRDYIHVEDLAATHLDALDYLRTGGTSITLNCGYGRGYSVREVLDAVQRVHGSPLDVREGPRRPGDPARIVADASRARRVLGWVPRFDDLELIVRHALDWERKLAAA